MKWTREAKETAVAVSILVVGGAALLLVLAGKSVHLPDVDVVAGARAALGAAVGVSLMLLGAILVYYGIRQGGRALLLLSGAILIVFPLPLIGVQLGVPAWLEPIVGLLQAIADLLQLLIDGAGRLVR